MPTDSAVRRFGPAELERFLTAVDAHLTDPVEIILIGGGAAAVGFGVDVGTQDLDTFTSIPATLEAAVRRARQDTGLMIPVGKAGVADGPYHLEDRLKRVMPQLGRLVVRVLDKHDLALSKVVRGYEHDLQQIEALHQTDPLDHAVMIQRFLGEMGHVVGNPRMIALAFFECIERLFGELARDRAEQQLRAAGRFD
jgi:hypothetical protein